VLSAKGYLKGAIEDYNEAIHLKPALAKTFYNRGGARFEINDVDGALQDFNEAIRLEPEAAALNKRGIVRTIKGDLEGALRDLDEAVRMNPYDAEIFNNRGVVRRERGDLEGALQDFSESARIKPDFALAVNNRDGLRKVLADRPHSAAKGDDSMIKTTKCSNPACAAVSPAGAAFCFKCGGKLELRCSNPQCGAVVGAGENVCGKCGMPVTPAVPGSDERQADSIVPTNDLEIDILENVASGLGVDNKLLANHIYTVPVDAYIKPNTEELGMRVALSQGDTKERALYVYTSGSMFNNVLFSERLKMFGGEYYKTTGQFLLAKWPLKEIVAKCEELGGGGINVNTGCERFAFYLSVEQARGLLAYSGSQ
jgi:tetratricopeptide (TPR) repeat protein